MLSLRSSIHLVLACLVFVGCLLSGSGTGARAAQEAAPSGNRLRHETSPYLLQHARNPVDWYPWGPEAFARARKEGKPIFLSIGYSACHWCHVMERESFEDQGVAQLLNEQFVAIKVDREERPDVDDLYLVAVQLLTERAGWPLSVFLTPEARPFHGGTYFPRDAFAELLRKVDELWRDPEGRKRIEAGAERVAKQLGQLSARVPTGGSAIPSLVPSGVKQLLAGMDETHGGFGSALKFPHPSRLLLLLAEQRKNPDPKLLAVLTLTLDRMARGGLYDQVGGGFHRYSTDTKWLVPHFEKMLYDNAQLARVYLEAHQLTQKPLYRRIAVETLAFVVRELRHPDGGFYSNLDADSLSPEGRLEEGRFYLWRPEEVIAALGKPDGALFNRVYDITSEGVLDGRGIPNLLTGTVESRAAQQKLSAATLGARLDTLRARLRRARETRPRPRRDDKVLADWNGLALQAFALAYEVTADPRYREAAERCAGFVLERMRAPAGLPGSPGRLVHSWAGGKAARIGFLEDQAYFGAGLLDLYRATGADRWRKEARALAEAMVADHWDQGRGQFFSTPSQHEPLLARLSAVEDGVTPSGPSTAAQVLLRLSQLQPEPRFRAVLQQFLDGHTPEMKRTPHAVPSLLLTTQLFFTPVETLRPAADTPVFAEIRDLPARITPGKPFTLAVQVRVQPGWHINSAAPGDPILIPTQLTTDGPGPPARVEYPPAKTVKLGFRSAPLRVYTGTATFRVTVPAVPGTTREVRLRLRYQACDDRVCLRPTQLVLRAPLPGR